MPVSRHSMTWSWDGLAVLVVVVVNKGCDWVRFVVAIEERRAAEYIGGGEEGMG